LNAYMREPLRGTASGCFCEAKRLPFLVQVLSLERKCLYVCYWCLLRDTTAAVI